MVGMILAALVAIQSPMAGSDDSQPPQAGELTMPMWLEIQQSAACPEGESALTIRTSQQGVAVTAFKSPGASPATMLPRLNALLQPVRYVAKIRVHCAVKAVVFEVEGYDAWRGPGAKAISRRFAVGGENLTPLP